jgi:hypothetical protein
MTRNYGRNTPTEKWCGHCKTMKPRTDFGLRTCGGTAVYCAPCLREYDRFRMRRHREKNDVGRGKGYCGDVLSWEQLGQLTMKWRSCSNSGAAWG